MSACKPCPVPSEGQHWASQAPPCHSFIHPSLLGSLTRSFSQQAFPVQRAAAHKASGFQQPPCPPLRDVVTALGGFLPRRTACLLRLCGRIYSACCTQLPLQAPG
jgi:hypothetical protein